jgi:threonine aldolase
MDTEHRTTRKSNNKVTTRHPQPPNGSATLVFVTKPERSFASDNNASIHPEVLEAISSANRGHAVGYGDDPYTVAAIGKFKQHFGDDINVSIVFNGTAANCLSLKAFTNSYHAIICTQAAHIFSDECGAPEKFTGCKLLPMPAPDGKLTVADAKGAYHGIGDQHHVQPKIISITQSTELGTVYSPEEIRALADFAHERNMFLHMDGARIANAAASLKLSLRAVSRDAGVDVLSFGGTKNGAMGAEALIFFNQKAGQDMPFLRKQGMQLASKMRFIAAQFDALLSNDLWLRNATQSNAMAQLLKAEISKIPQVKVVYEVQANGVFARIPKEAIAKVQEQYFFYVWDEAKSVVRWMCSFDTTEEDVKQFAKAVAAAIGS